MHIRFSPFIATGHKPRGPVNLNVHYLASSTQSVFDEWLNYTKSYKPIWRGSSRISFPEEAVDKIIARWEGGKFNLLSIPSKEIQRRYNIADSGIDLETYHLTLRNLIYDTAVNPSVPEICSNVDELIHNPKTEESGILLADWSVMYGVHALGLGRQMSESGRVPLETELEKRFNTYDLKRNKTCCNGCCSICRKYGFAGVNPSLVT